MRHMRPRGGRRVKGPRWEEGGSAEVTPELGLRG